jgi:ATP-dependent RNA helicase DOB1
LGACSCFVCQEKSDRGTKLSDEMSAALKIVQEAARRVAKVSIECKMEVRLGEGGRRGRRGVCLVGEGGEGCVW